MNKYLVIMAAFILVNCNISFSSDNNNNLYKRTINNNNISNTQHNNKNNKVDINEIRKALYKPNDPKTDQLLKKKIDKVKSPRDVYLAPEVDYASVIADRLFDSDNNVDMQCPFEKDPDL